MMWVTKVWAQVSWRGYVKQVYVPAVVWEGDEREEGTRGEKGQERGRMYVVQCTREGVVWGEQRTRGEKGEGKGRKERSYQKERGIIQCRKVITFTNWSMMTPTSTVQTLSETYSIKFVSSVA